MTAMAPEKDLRERLRELEERLEEAEETLRAIRAGEVDAIVVSAPDGDRVYTLTGADEVYRVLVQDMAEGAVTLARDGLILFANEQFASMAGIPLDRVIGSRFQEFVAPEDDATISALLSARDRWRGEVRLKAQGAATLVPVYLSVSTLVFDSVECVSALITDLEEQKRKQELLEAERLSRRLNLHVENSPLAVVEWDGDFRITRWAGAAEQMFGWAAAEVLGKGIDELPWIYREDIPLGNEVIAEMRSGKRPSNVSKGRNVRKDGAVIYCEWYNTSLRDDSGRLVSVLSQVLDVTERTRADEALRASNEQFRRLCEANIIGIVTADWQCILDANEVFLRMVGYTREDLEGGRIRWKELTPAECQHLDERGIEELLATGSCKPFEKEYFRKDGSRVPILIGATLLERSPLKFLCFILDLTERKELEKRLFEKQKLESIGLLAGGIAHDFNNILVGILGNASLAQDMVPEHGPVARLLGEVMNASERAAHLTKQMLAYSGKGQFFIEPVNLSDLVMNTTRLLQTSIPNRVALRLELERNLPVVHADSGQMQQVVMNLVLNAAEAIGDDVGTISLRTGVRCVDRGFIQQELRNAEIEPGTYVWISVRDTGCGMDEVTMARMFDPFFTTKFTGRGLGLAAVGGILRGHKGAIKVTSAPGKGSSFLVLFPAAAEAVSQAAAETVPPVGPPRIATEAELHGAGTVLVVDDEDVVLRTAKLALERHGYTVLQAASGPAAIEILKDEKNRVCAVILDLSMPGMSGQDALPEIRKVRPDVKVIVSSGYNEAETMQLFSGQTLSGFLQKPYTVARLAERVKAALERR